MTGFELRKLPYPELGFRYFGADRAFEMLKRALKRGTPLTDDEARYIMDALPPDVLL